MNKVEVRKKLHIHQLFRLFNEGEYFYTDAKQKDITAFTTHNNIKSTSKILFAVDNDGTSVKRILQVTIIDKSLYMEKLYARHSKINKRI